MATHTIQAARYPNQILFKLRKFVAPSVFPDFSLMCKRPPKAGAHALVISDQIEFFASTRSAHENDVSQHSLGGRTVIRDWLILTVAWPNEYSTLKFVGLRYGGSGLLIVTWYGMVSLVQTLGRTVHAHLSQKIWGCWISLRSGHGYD